MKILIVIIFSVIFLLLFEKKVKKQRGIFYCGALLIGVLTGLFSDKLYPVWMNTFITDYIQKGVLASALFIIVMYAPLMPKKSRFIRVFMGARGEIAIIASLLIMSHCIRYGISYLRMIFASTYTMRTADIITLIVCGIMIVLLIPLTITSFQRIRKKMNARKWKDLQKWSYLFYGLIYIHVAVLYLPRACAGSIPNFIDMCIYSLIFGIYTVLRLRKFLLKKKQNKAAGRVMIAGFLTIAGGIILMAVSTLGIMIPNVENAKEKEVTANVKADEVAETVDSEEATAKEYKDGTWIGEGNGFNGIVKVEVTIQEGKIQSINVLENVDDYEYFSVAEEGIIQEVLEQQTSEVDAVSGATFSSKGIKEAVSNALEMSNE